MGYSKDGSITNYWPDDTDRMMYLSGSYSLEEIIEKCNEKWPGVSLSELEISAEEIHTNCIYYDLYDPSDYTDFVVITKI